MEVKRKLYSRRGVHEYWVVDWKLRQVELYRREEAVLTLQATLFAEDMITTPLLPGFRCQVRRLFADIEL
jgi:Uma2 family endonuclease